MANNLRNTLPPGYPLWSFDSCSRGVTTWGTPSPRSASSSSSRTYFQPLFFPWPQEVMTLFPYGLNVSAPFLPWILHFSLFSPTQRDRREGSGKEPASPKTLLCARIRWPHDRKGQVCFSFSPDAPAGSSQSPLPSAAHSWRHTPSTSVIHPKSCYGQRVCFNTFQAPPSPEQCLPHGRGGKKVFFEINW